MSVQYLDMKVHNVCQKGKKKKQGENFYRTEEKFNNEIMIIIKNNRHCRNERISQIKNTVGRQTG